MSKIIFFCAVLLLTVVSQQDLFAQDARFRVPLNGGSIVCVFNDLNCAVAGKNHTGIDYHATGGNKDILATNAGKIVSLTYNGSNDHGMGNAIIIEHKVVNVQGGIETLYSLYGHLASFIPGLYEGEAVVKGQKLGTMGSTGKGQTNCWGTTPHLHFEIKTASVLNNPSGGGPYWGYTPGNAANYGYIDPTWFVNSSSTAIGNDYAFWNFTGNENLEGWSLINIEGWAVGSGFLWYNPVGADPYIVSPELFVDASVLRYVRVRLASNALDGTGYIYFKTAAENTYHDNRKVFFQVSNCTTCNKNAPFNDYLIYMGGHTSWSGKITGIRIDPAFSGNSGTDADLIKFDSIRLSAN